MHGWQQRKQKSTDCGDRTHDHEIKSLALYRTELSRLVGSMENISQYILKCRPRESRVTTTRNIPQHSAGSSCGAVARRQNVDMG